MREAVIIPTGDEIRDNIVLDTDSPEIMAQLLRLYPGCLIHRIPPVRDKEEDICAEVERWVQQSADLIVLIGGSGGGHRFSGTLGKDYTHTAMDRLLEAPVSREIYGKNGHMWCKLICGRRGQSLIINLPGPFVEAQAAFGAFCTAYTNNQENLKAINEAMVAAVMAQYH